MRRVLMILAALAVTGSVGITLIGCPATHDGYPGKACKIDSDCYLGELCNQNNGMCEPPPADMSVLLDFPMPDFVINQDLTGADLSEASDMTQVDL